MKKTILLYALVFISFSIYGQDGFKFKIKVEQNKTYTTQLQTSTDGSVKVIADETILEKMKEGGMESTMKIQQELNLTLVSKTSDKDDQGNIPAIMTYEKLRTEMMVNGKPIVQDQALDGMKIIGKYNPENKFEIDSITGEGVTDEIRSTMSSTMENIQQQIVFPEDEIKIGGAFENEIPMTIPMQGMNPMEIVVKTRYLLKEIENNIAYFDTEQSITLDTVQEQMNMTASGTGKGTCEFNIKDNYLIQYETDLPMDLSMTMNEMMSMKMRMNTKTHSTVTVK